ncbi:serine/threonine-protein kinase [Aureimonas jatrophae]|uniref:Serine/threonine protein kinase n=2 Tax=Aureimonas jatrophae TaxID=1166073 RepID=A0A1H0NHD2_9HYPH|nr:serine/threonine-protein kinase [Aureimonas jatrophae]SDO92177.1 serine/threonine protein kinase [Aureimonas jatrophae]
MSDTLVCFDSNLQRNVVVKTLKPGIEKQRLMDELSALADIRSKYVVQVLDVIKKDGDVVGFVEEYIDGNAITPIANPASSDTILRYLYSIAAGISDVHDHGRLHRDIKPENMRFDYGGTLKIFDFGLSKLNTSAKTKTLYFTPGYSPPEIFSAGVDGNHNFTEAVDVFSFGVTAYWILNGGSIPADFFKVPPIVPPTSSLFDALAVVSEKSVSVLLDSCLCAEPSNRPAMREVKSLLGDYILKGQHKMLLTYNGQRSTIDINKPNVSLTVGSNGISISYNGLGFVVSNVTGFVRINNKQVAAGHRIKGSVVIVLGDPSGGIKTSITADVSHPEVMH